MICSAAARTAFLSVLVAGAACTCGSPTPAVPDPLGQQNQVVLKGEDGKGQKLRKERKPRKPPVRPERQGYVAADVGGKPVRFGTLPKDKNHIFPIAPRSLALVDAYPGEEETKEHFIVRIQGYDLSSAVNRPMHVGKDRDGTAREPKTASVIYTDGEGKRYAAHAGLGGGVEMEILEWVPTSQRLKGKFSGKLKLRESEETIEVKGGEFVTELVKGEEAPDAKADPPAEAKENAPPK